MADTYLLDTCILPQYFNRDPDNVVDEKTRRFRQRIREVEDANVTICTVTLGEVEYGLRAAKLKAVEKQERVREALRRFQYVFGVSEATAVPCYAQAKADVFRRYAPKAKKQKKREQIFIDELADPTSGKELQVQENDLWIAAVALEHNFVLVSSDSGMERIRAAFPSLRLENWLAP